MIDKFTEQKIKDSAKIVDVVSDFLELKRKGKDFECLCPFHADRHLGSFNIHPATNTYRCFSCEAKGGPIEFLMNYAKMSYPDSLRYLASKYGIHISEEPDARWKDIKPAKPRSIEECIPANLPPRLWPAEWVNLYRDIDGDNLVRWMRSIPWDGCQRQRLEEVLEAYKVGHARMQWYDEEEFTLFWELDQQGRLHNAHMMKYMPNGHRIKGKEGHGNTWLHARMKYAKRFDDTKNSTSYCIFGLHLLNRYPRAAVHLVESEKTAILMATAYGNNDLHVWMAVCGIQNLNEERLRPLIEAKRKIVLFPDRDGIDAWSAKAMDIPYPVSINTTAVRKWWHPEDGEKADIADVVVNSIIRNAPNKPTTQPVCEVMEEMAKTNPALGTLIDKFNLKPEDGTKEE